jgi:hypothetical protein
MFDDIEVAVSIPANDGGAKDPSYLHEVGIDSLETADSDVAELA